MSFKFHLWEIFIEKFQFNYECDNKINKNLLYFCTY